MNDQTLTLLDLLAKGTVVLLLGFGCIAFMRRLSAAQRSLAWLAVFGALLLLPLAIFVRPVWTVDVPVVKQRVKLASDPVSLVVKTRGTEDMVLAPTSESVADPAWTVWQWLEAFYVSGVALVLGFRLIGSWQLGWLKRQHAREFHGEARVRQMVRALCDRHGIRRRVRVPQSDRAIVPMTWGVFNPVLMMPSACSDWTDDDLRAALEHEMAHIRHCDAARRWLATFVCALWWPHPLVWVAGKAWRLEQERACDDAALCSGASAERYAGQLLEAAKSVRLGGFQSAAALVMAMPSGLETRLRAVVGDGVNRSAAGRFALLSSAAMALMVVTICAVCQAQNVAAPDQGERQIKVAIKFIDIKTNKNSAKLPQMIETMTDGGKALTPEEAAELVRQLSQRKGVDVMSAPTVVARSGQKALLQVAREFGFPTALKEDGLTPSKFDTLPVGVMLDVTPTFTADGRIDLDLAPLVREFEGFSVPSQPKKLFDAKADLKKELRKGDLPKPVFTERKWQGRVPLNAGDWFAHDLVIRKDSATDLSADGSQFERRILFLVTAEEVKADKVQSSAPPIQEEAKTTLQKARKIVLPVVEFHEAKLTEAVAFLCAKSLELDPNKEGVNIILKPGTSATAEITLSLRDVPLNEALRYVTELSMAKLSYEPFAVEIGPLVAGGEGDEMLTRVYAVPSTLLGTEKSAKNWLATQGIAFPDGASAVFDPGTYRLTVKNTEPELRKVEKIVEKIVASPSSAEALRQLKSSTEKLKVELAAAVLKGRAIVMNLETRARLIVLPQVEFSGATIEEAVEFLQVKSRQLDPDKKGVNIVLKKADGQPATMLSISLKDVPLWEALRYVSELAGMKLEAGEDAIVIRPLGAITAQSNAKAPAVPGKIELVGKTVDHDQATGVTTATGDARATGPLIDAKAGNLRYDSKAGTLEATGTFEIRRGNFIQFSNDLSSRAVIDVNTGELRVYGPSKTKVIK